VRKKHRGIPTQKSILRKVSGFTWILLRWPLQRFGKLLLVGLRKAPRAFDRLLGNSEEIGFYESD